MLGQCSWRWLDKLSPALLQHTARSRVSLARSGQNTLVTGPEASCSIILCIGAVLLVLARYSTILLATTSRSAVSTITSTEWLAHLLQDGKHPSIPFKHTRHPGSALGAGSIVDSATGACLYPASNTVSRHCSVVLCEVFSLSYIPQLLLLLLCLVILHSKFTSHLHLHLCIHSAFSIPKLHSDIMVAITSSRISALLAAFATLTFAQVAPPPDFVPAEFFETLSIVDLRFGDNLVIAGEQIPQQGAFYDFTSNTLLTPP